MKHWTLASAAVGLFCVILLVNAPARLLGYFLPPEQVAIEGFKGSLWRGSANSAAVAVVGGFLQLGRLEWQLSPWSLLMLSPRVDLKARWGRQTVDANISVSPTGTVRLRDTSVKFPARLLQQWLPIQLRGSITLLATDLSLRKLRPASGGGRLVWRNARWIGNSGSQDLGDYVLEFAVADEQRLEGVVSTLSGPIRVEGEITYDHDRYSVDARLHSEAGISSELGNALELMAAPVEDGYHIKLSGTL